MAMIKCMCGYDKSSGDCKAIHLTAAEKKNMIEQGQTPIDTAYYCPPCLRLIEDPEQGPKFMRGVAEQQLRQAGVPSTKAKDLADNYYKKLKELQRKAKHGTHS